MAENLRFNDKVVIITGAGAGLGRSHALMFGARGAKVVVNDLGGGFRGEGKSAAAADKVVEEIKALGGSAVASYDSVEDGDKIVQAAMDAFGTVDVVVNNAGILRDTSFQKMTNEDWDLIYRVHLYGTFRVTHAAWPIMRDKKYGRIIVTSSDAGIFGNFGQANYAAMKLGVLGMAKTLALEGVGKNIYVNTIAPLAASRMTKDVIPPQLFDYLKPEYISPLVGWLCHESCEETGSLFEVGAATVNKLRWERTRGHAFSINATLTPDDFAAHWDKICDFTDAEHPATLADAAGAAFQNITNPKRGGNAFLDLDLISSAAPVTFESSYDERDLSLYALGVGAGANPLDPAELSLVHERGDKFFALPTFAVMPAFNGFMQSMQEGKQPPGMNVGFDRILHGEQYTEIKRLLPSHAKLKHECRIRDAYDKGKDAVAIMEVISFDEAGEEVARNELTTFLRGCGGWGGDRGPAGDLNVPPQREPDAVIEEKTSDSQALLYRLSGDWNPLHVDPEFARNFGFDRPILHGLCTFGYVGRHVIKAFCNNDPRFFKSIKVRFAKSVFPGDTLVTRMWKESDQRIILETLVKERNEVVISNAAVELFAEIPQAKAKAAATVAAAVDEGQPAKLTGRSVFQAIADYVAKNPALAGQVKTSFQFNLSAPDSSWAIDLKSDPGKVYEGTLDKPDATLKIADEDFLAMCTGADPQKLFLAGKLKVSGNVMAATKLEFLKNLDPKAFSAAAPAGAAGAAAPAPTPAKAATRAGRSGEVFAALGKRLSSDAKAIGGVAGKVLAFTIREPAAQWAFDCTGKTPQLSETAPANADAVLTLDDADLVALVQGQADALNLFRHGQLRVDGDVRLAHELGFLKNVI